MILILSSPTLASRNFIVLSLTVWINFCIRSKICLCLLFFFFRWKYNCFGTICWKDYSFLTELTLLLFKDYIDSICVDLFWGSFLFHWSVYFCQYYIGLVLMVSFFSFVLYCFSWDKIFLCSPGWQVLKPGSASLLTLFNIVLAILHLLLFHINHRIKICWDFYWDYVGSIDQVGKKLYCDNTESYFCGTRV
jgi:hypothetical protein